MSNLIRIATGTVTANDLLTTSSYLVTNWTRPTDILSKASIQWSASQPEVGVTRILAGSLETGAFKWNGLFSGVIEFFILTPLMREYIEDTILGSNGGALVTVYLHTPRQGFQVFQGEMLTPFAANAETSYSRFDDTIYTNNQYLFRRGKKVTLKAWGAIDGSAWSWIDGSAIGKVTQT